MRVGGVGEEIGHGESMLPRVAATALREEATELLRELIRLDTVNPPGNETRAADLLRAYLEDAGVECETYARVPDRANLVARIPGSGGRRLLLLGHTDTVLADPEEWAVDPWSGDVREGAVWGRGALDMKSQVAANAVAIATLARDGFRPSGDLVFAATADEEVGADFGLSWLCREHPEAVRAEYCLNEGGGDRTVVNGRPVYLCAVAEKMSSPFVLRVRGRSGHASMPRVADNALVKAAALVERLAEFEPEPRLLPETEMFFGALFDGVPVAREVAERVRRLEPTLAGMVEPMLGLTVSPTMISASEKRNVVPAVCEVTCDCRLLPGQSQAEAQQTILGWLGGGDYELTWIEGVGGSRSSPHTPLWEALSRWVEREEPAAAVVPNVLPGFTDSHYLREAFGTIAYGFFPMRAMTPELAARLVHSADERIPVDDVELGTRFLIDVSRDLLR
jgi:acetylornithine deacetylase/succinyl-diaminopimelate desuccinylase-like protein